MSPKIQIGVTITMVLTCVLLFVRISKAVAFIYLLGFGFLTFICPYWLIFIQKYKKYCIFVKKIFLVMCSFLFYSEIHGPWDEARPRLQRPRRNMYRKRAN